MDRVALAGLPIEIAERLSFRLEPFVPFGVTDVESFLALWAAFSPQAFSYAGMRGLERAPGPHFPLGSGEPEATLYRSPVPRWGISFSLPQPSGQAVAFAPFMSEGLEHLCEIEELTLAPDRLSAIVSGSVGHLPISFYDPCFAETRHQMAAGSANHILFAGLCLKIAPHEPSPIVVESELPDASFGPPGAPPDQTGVIRTDEMVAIMPIDGLEADFYSVCGPVTRVQPGDLEWLGQRFWRIRMVVARDIYPPPVPSFRPHGDFEIELVLTETILDDGKVPEVGDRITSTIWLQGRLWSAGPVGDGP